MQDLIQFIILFGFVGWLVWLSAYFFVRAASEKATKRYVKQSKALLRRAFWGSLRWLVVDLPTIIGQGVARGLSGLWRLVRRGWRHMTS